MGKYKHKNENDYNWERIGQRIKEERKDANLTQQELMAKIGRSGESYRELGKWENGKAKPQLSDILELCKVFDCEIGYLLCEYSCKSKIATDIQDVTGLSEEAIKKLKMLNSLATEADDSPVAYIAPIMSERLEIINILFESEYLFRLCEEIQSFSKCAKSLMFYKKKFNDIDFTKSIPHTLVISGGSVDDKQKAKARQKKFDNEREEKEEIWEEYQDRLKEMRLYRLDCSDLLLQFMEAYKKVIDESFDLGEYVANYKKNKQLRENSQKSWDNRMEKFDETWMRIFEELPTQLGLSKDAKWDEIKEAIIKRKEGETNG